MASILDAKGYHRAMALAPDLRAPSEQWTADMAAALGFELLSKSGREIKATRWHDDGRVEIEVYMVNGNGERYLVGEGAGRRPATEWLACPVDPPSGLKAYAEQED